MTKINVLDEITYVCIFDLCIPTLIFVFRYLPSCTLKIEIGSKYKHINISKNKSMAL